MKNKKYAVEPLSRIDTLPRQDPDELGLLTDDELAQYLHKLQVDRNQAFSAKIWSRPWEDEICYVKREMNLRHIRREMHDDYLKRQDEEVEALKQEELTLPKADLDNMDFVQAWASWKGRTYFDESDRS